MNVWDPRLDAFFNFAKIIGREQFRPCPLYVRDYTKLSLKLYKNLINISGSHSDGERNIYSQNFHHHFSVGRVSNNIQFGRRSYRCFAH